MLEMTKEQQIAKHYSACMDSVNLIKELAAKQVKTPDEVQRIASNKEHLKIMLAKDFWTTENLNPIKEASK